MGKKRKEPKEITPNDNTNTSSSSSSSTSTCGSSDPISVDREELLELTRMAKSWEFTCSFCFKKFPSAQAVGGHQNAHRSERMEEKRLAIRDPIGHRKRAYLRAMKAAAASNTQPSPTTMSSPDEGLNNPPADGTSHDAAGSGSSSAELGLDEELDLTLRL